MIPIEINMNVTTYTIRFEVSGCPEINQPLKNIFEESSKEFILRIKKENNY